MGQTEMTVTFDRSRAAQICAWFAGITGRFRLCWLTGKLLRLSYAFCLRSARGPDGKRLNSFASAWRSVDVDVSEMDD